MGWNDDVEYAITSSTDTPPAPEAAPSLMFGLPGAGSGRALSLGLAALMALLPLLPSAAAYAGGPPYGYIDLAAVAVLVLWVPGRIEARGRTPAPWPLPLWPWHLLIGIVLGATATGLLAEHRVDSAVFSAILRTHLQDLLLPMDQAAHPLQPLRVAMTFLEGWLVLVLVSDLCRRAAEPHARALLALTGWIAGLTLVCAFALVQYVTRFALHPYWVKANPNIVRAHATLDDPNALGAYLVLGIGVAAGWLYFGGRHRRWQGALFALALAGLATTMSRAAIGAAVLAPIVVLACVPPAATDRQRRVRTAGRLAIAGLVVVVGVSMGYRLVTTERTRTQPVNQTELVLKTLDPRESTDWVLRGRLAWWKAAVRMFADEPLTGVGIGRFPRLLAEYGGGRSRENAHNLWLQLFAEAGAAGGVAFAVFSVALCVTFAGKVRAADTSQARAIALGGLIAVVAFLLTHLTGHSLLLPSGQILFCSFVAIVAGLATWRPGPPAPRQGGAVPGRLRLALAALALILMYPAVSMLQGVTPAAGPWGYATGLFPEEPAGAGVSYRWTTANAILDIDVPAARTTLELPLAAPSPIRGGAPVRVTVSAGEWIHEVVLSSPDVRTVRVALDRGREDGPGRVVVRIDVQPTFSPARAHPASGDHRTLGVQLLPPQFSAGR